MSDYQQKDGSGALFKNTKKVKDTHPDYHGSFTLNGKKYNVAGWIKKSKAGDGYLSLAVSDWKEREPKQPTSYNPVTNSNDFIDDSIPFQEITLAHFYEKTADGIIPRHFVPMTSRPGESRPTRITDARKHGWTPSVTTILQMLDKPALNDWRVNEYLKTVFALGNLEGFDTLEYFCKYIKDKTQEALDKAPKDGTDFHDSMEAAYSAGAIEDDWHREITNTVMSDVEAHTGVASEMFTPETSFIHPMGFAGKVDLRSLSWCIDWKTKNTKDKWKPGKMVYQEHLMQLAAYRVGLGLPNARCANVFICLETGEVEFCEHSQEELDIEWANFSDLLRIWLRRAKYIPGSL